LSYDGNPIHVALEMNEVALYMQGVRTQTEFRMIVKQPCPD